MNWYIVQAYSGFEKKVVESIKEELKKNKLSDNLEEIFENREQIEVSRYYERLPKSGAIAMQELEQEKIYWRATEEGEGEEADN